MINEQETKIKEMELTPEEIKFYEEMIENQENVPEEPEDFKLKKVNK